MSLPRVTVICLCYNQERFVKEAILSVLDQTYSNIQLIVVDDASTDNSAGAIEDLVNLHPRIKFLKLSNRSGNCRAFNQALTYAEGEYIIDLAADDALLPARVSKGVEALARENDRFGVNFTDADLFGEDGTHLHKHSDRFPHASVPEGDIYRDLIERFFICSPTMIFRREVIEKLGGYDEDLAYEDFDFWIRSSREFCYCYTPEVLVKKRIVRNSMSEKQFSFFSRQLRSTFRVCEKIMALNQSIEEQKALSRRILYEIKICIRFLNVSLAGKYMWLYAKNAAARFP